MSDSTEEDANTNGLEVGMMGMNLMSGLGADYAPDLKATNFSRSPLDVREGILLHPQEGMQSSVRPSLGSERISESKRYARSAGLGDTPSSPVTKPEHKTNNSTPSPSLTLTPNSSVDGNSDWNSLGNKASPFNTVEAPAMPFLHTHSRRDGQMITSFDRTENEDDGLLGLEALRERAYSSPGHLAQSPPIMRGNVANQSTSTQSRNPSRDRPPLSHSTYGEGSSSYGGDRSVGERSIGSIGQVAGDRSVGDRSVGSIGLYSGELSADNGSVGSQGQSNQTSRNQNTFGFDAHDTLGFGAIGRTELRQSAIEYDPSRRRASSSDTFGHLSGRHSGPYTQPVSQKFASFPTLGAHIRHQRMPQSQHSASFGDLQKPRHIRSVSQPVVGNLNGSQLPPGLQVDPRYYQQANQYGEDIYKSGVASRSSTTNYPVQSSSYEGVRYPPQKHRGSMPNLPAASLYGPTVGGYPPLQRRESVDFLLHPNTPQQKDAEEMRGFGPSVISPRQNQMQYATHNRIGSDSGMFGSHVSTGGVPVRGHISARHLIQNNGDSELALVADHFGDSSADYLRGSSNPLRVATHSHSMSLDQMPQQYLEGSQHVSAMNINMAMPKVVYNVKFKRSQRNFVLGPRISRDLKIGTYVKVEADRGEDLGIVVGMVPAERYSFSSRSSFSSGVGPAPSSIGSSNIADLKCIIRLATHDEVSLLTIKRDEEEELLKICRGKVRQRGLPMHVVDAEYQFDRHKLTFFFEAEGRVDFRELVRDLFSMYKTRIWMQQLDKTTSTSSPAMMVPTSQNFQMDFGTPIIAPVSEFADSVMFHGASGTDSSY